MWLPWQMRYVGRDNFFWLSQPTPRNGDEGLQDETSPSYQHPLPLRQEGRIQRAEQMASEIQLSKTKNRRSCGGMIPKHYLAE